MKKVRKYIIPFIFLSSFALFTNSKVDVHYSPKREVARATNAKIDLDKSPATPLWVNTTFTSNMVLQRNKRVKIFGYGGEAGEVVTVNFAGQTKTTENTADGWALYLDAMIENKVGQTLTIIHKEQTITLTNVVVGDVLLCSGQSNMAFQLQYFVNKRASVKTEYMSLNNYKNIRVYDASSVNLERSEPTIYQESLGRSWKLCNDYDSIKFYSAYALGAASNYSSVVGDSVPIGIIIAAVSGTQIEEWIDPATIASNSFISYAGDRNSRYYNGYIHNLAGYTISGFLWYQGCSNADPGMVNDYKIAFSMMLSHYRQIFENPTLPAIVQQLVQLTSVVEISYIRIAQWKFMSTISNVYTINGFDTGDMSPTDGIHPVDKWVLGQRVAGALALASGIKKDEMLNQDLPYGVSSAITSATCVQDGDEKVITINTANEDDYWTATGDITGFQIFCDYTWQDVTATVVDGKIQIRTTLAEATRIRYNFCNGYIHGGSQPYARVETPVFVYAGGLPLAIARRIDVEMSDDPLPPTSSEPDVSEPDTEEPSDSAIATSLPAETSVPEEEAKPSATNPVGLTVGIGILSLGLGLGLGVLLTKRKIIK